LMMKNIKFQRKKALKHVIINVNTILMYVYIRKLT